MLAAVSIVVFTLLTVTSTVPAPTVWILGPVDSALVERVRGQLSDLEWRIAQGPVAPVVKPATEIGSTRAIVSFEVLPDDGLWVRLSVPDGRRWRREVRGLGRAANYEAAALVLRSALLAIEEGAAPSWSAEDQVEPGPLAAPPPWGWTVAGRTQVTGVAPAGGLQLEGFRRWSAWTLALRGNARWPYLTETDGGELRIGQHDLRLAAGYDFRLAPGWSLGPRVGAGAVLWHRQTRATSDTIAGTPLRYTVGGVASAGLRLKTRFAPGWIVMFSAGADGLFGAPRWALADGTRLAEPWAVQPWLALGLGGDPMFATEP